ncbi:hypothetical protein Y10_16420 [Neptunitalea sp. Y10]|uniref:Thioredoxin reductase n=1 Tax=Neptunitalea lumnitzerae TaxID=2965509 RepID=A0ABQ5MIR8_9FLAO|nr:hypothetical protein Y10_16420 [Neptunitalea sp. Y10]
MNTTTDYEVIIIGGSFAGLSAAMALGRSLRKTLIIDSGKPCNQPTPHSHNPEVTGSTPVYAKKTDLRNLLILKRFFLFSIDL